MKATMKLRMALALTAAMLVGTSPAEAQTAADTVERHSRFSKEFPLERLMTRSEDVTLRSSADEYSFWLPISPRIRVTQATLALVYTNSISLLESRSQLKVELNGKVLAQVSLRPKEPEGLLRVNLPPELLEPGYNQVAIHVAQHYVEQCEDPSAAELWTQIDTGASSLRFEYDGRPVETDLSALPRMVDALGWDPYRMAVLTPPGELQDEKLLAGAHVSAGMAALLEYRPLHVVHRTARSIPEEAREDVTGRTAMLADPGATDAVLMGTKDALAPFLTPTISAEIDGPYLGVSRLVADASRLVLIVSGHDSAEVSQAALALALAGRDLPDAPSMTVRDLAAPDLPRYAHSNAISAQKRYEFSSFGMQTVTLGGTGSNEQELEIWVPPDLFTPADSMLELHLHMAYGAGSDPTSVVNVELNGRFASAIRLVSEDGGIFRDYVIPVPAYWLRPGRNTIRFNAYMTPMSEGDVCFTPSDASLLVSLFDDSWLMLTQGRHHVELPDLSLFGRTGFPYTSPADGREFHVRVGARDSDIVSAAWTLVGKLTQLGEVPLWRGTIANGTAVTDRHELIVGVLGGLPAEAMQGAPVAFGDNGLLRPELLRMPQGRAETGTVSNFFRQGQGVADGPPTDPALASVGYEATSNGRAYLLQFQSPQSEGRLVTAVTAAQPATLRRAVARLVEHDLWGAIKGDLAAWTPEGDVVATASVGEAFHIGEKDLRSRANFFFSERPVLWMGLLVLAVIAFVLSSVYLLRGRARKNA